MLVEMLAIAIARARALANVIGKAIEATPVSAKMKAMKAAILMFLFFAHH